MSEMKEKQPDFKRAQEVMPPCYILDERVSVRCSVKSQGESMLRFTITNNQPESVISREIWQKRGNQEPQLKCDGTLQTSDRIEVEPGDIVFYRLDGEMFKTVIHPTGV